MKTRLTIALAGFSLVTRIGSAQQLRATPKGGPGAPATIRAALLRTPLTLDGRLDEPVWATADSIDDFRQREPREGSPATERTVVKVAHDAAALYIAVRCYDSDMRALRASQLRRDADLSSDDNVRLLIDSFDDRRSAFVLGTNPNGAMWDAQFSGVDDLNDNWNGVWTSPSRVMLKDGRRSSAFRCSHCGFAPAPPRSSGSMSGASFGGRTRKTCGARTAGGRGSTA